MDILNKILSKGYDISIKSEARRTEIDCTGKKLSTGRDFYSLYTFELDNGEESIESEWPGYWDYKDLLKELKKQIK